MKNPRKLQGDIVQHTISALVHNRPGVLADMAEKFKEHGVNIRSIAAGETERPEITRIVISVDGQNGNIERVREAMQAMDVVISVDDMDRRDFVDRELALIKVAMDRDSTTQLMQIFEVFRADVVGMGTKTITVEMTGDEERVTAFVRMLAPFGIKSMCRTGMIALTRGDE
jgi:acetolactate synthase-1/3 small subunit